MTKKKKPGPRSCPRCGKRFTCRNDDILNCQCATVALSPEDRAYIAARYDCCLCADCLRALAAGKRKALAEARQARCGEMTGVVSRLDTVLVSPLQGKCRPPTSGLWPEGKDR